MHHSYMAVVFAAPKPNKLLLFYQLEAKQVGGLNFHWKKDNDI